MRNIHNAVFVIGPTASGKSDLALTLAKRLDGEIVNADSMQIYKGMDIGTAKLDASQRQGIAHHLLDIVDIGQAYSVADYKQAALGIMEDISKRGRMPIVCGGTGLYVSALTSKLDFSTVKGDEALRQSYIAYAQQHGNEALHEKLRAVDPELAARLHPNDVKRIVRGLEVYELTGKPLSQNGKGFTSEQSEDYPFCLLGLEWPREQLDERIYARVDAMMEQGLYGEARAIYAQGVDFEHPSMMALGYRQLFRHFRGECTLDEAVADIKRETRRFAKRQMTWFRRDLRIHWLPANQYTTANSLADAAMEIIAK